MSSHRRDLIDTIELSGQAAYRRAVNVTQLYKTQSTLLTDDERDQHQTLQYNNCYMSGLMLARNYLLQSAFEEEHFDEFNLLTTVSRIDVPTLIKTSSSKLQDGFYHINDADSIAQSLISVFDHNTALYSAGLRQNHYKHQTAEWTKAALYSQAAVELLKEGYETGIFSTEAELGSMFNSTLHIREQLGKFTQDQRETDDFTMFMKLMAPGYDYFGHHKLSDYTKSVRLSENYDCYEHGHILDGIYLMNKRGTGFEYSVN